MKKSRYTETQIARILKEVEGGRLVKGREYSISDATYYNWKAKYGVYNDSISFVSPLEECRRTF